MYLVLIFSHLVWHGSIVVGLQTCVRISAAVVILLLLIIIIITIIIKFM